MRQVRARRRGRQGGQLANDQVTLTRKQMRKEKKQAKKERMRQYYQQPRNHNQPLSPFNKHAQKVPSNGRQEAREGSERKQEKKGGRWRKERVRREQESADDKLIKMYESKLGMGSGRDNYNKIAKKYGFDDDIFAFLDGISQKVRDRGKQEENQESVGDEERDGREYSMEEDDQEMIPEGEEVEGQQWDEMFDNLDQIPRDDDEENLQAQEEGEEQCEAEEIEAQPEPSIVKYRSPFNKGLSQSQIQIKRSVNSLFNKLSDGNILLTFRELMQLFESNSRSQTIPIFAEAFTRFNLMTEKPLFHILATNVALLAALHYAIGNRLLAPALHALTMKYEWLERSEEDNVEILELGYSKRVQRMKNYAMVVALLYNYGSISGDFIESYVDELAADLNKEHIELLYLLIQKCGVRVRQSDPSTLRSVISTVKKAIDQFRKDQKGEEEQQKIKFIELQLNQIKFNKKNIAAVDQRMAFLDTFILKNVPKEIQKQKESFPLTYKQLCQADTSKTNWWHFQGQSALLGAPEERGEADQGMTEVTAEKRKLLKLAKSFQLVTEAKKNVFVCLMDSQDYLEATQRILELKIRNMQEVASVLVQVCSLQPAFNPYYALVAAKLASLMPKFRMQLQYSVWDHLKLIHDYPLRRTNNIAKFAARLVSDPTANHSLSILKYYPDLSSLPAHDHTFLTIFFKHFFRKVSRGYIGKLVNKLRQLNNRDIRLAIQEYLQDYDAEQGLKEKVKFCRRVLALEVEELRLQEKSDQE